MEILTAVLVAGLALLGVVSGHILTRVRALESDLAAARAYNRALWAYCRRLLDLYYQHRSPGSPDPEPVPDGD